MLLYLILIYNIYSNIYQSEYVKKSNYLLTRAACHTLSSEQMSDGKVWHVEGWWFNTHPCQTIDVNTIDVNLCYAQHISVRDNYNVQ